jgi:hypothetical protein
MKVLDASYGFPRRSSSLVVLARRAAISEKTENAAH